MTKETMIWQSLSMVIAGMVQRDEIPDTVREFENRTVRIVGSFIGYSNDDIRKVLQTKDCTGFADKLAEIYKSTICKDES